MGARAERRTTLAARAARTARTARGSCGRSHEWHIDDHEKDRRSSYHRGMLRVHVVLESISIGVSRDGDDHVITAVAAEAFDRLPHVELELELAVEDAGRALQATQTS